MRTRTIIVGSLALLLLQGPTNTRAASVMVPPGNGTLQAAIDAAAPGTTLMLSGGTYSGPITITKKLTLTHSTSFTDAAPAYLDGGCTSPTAVTIAADGVRLAGHAHRIRFPKGCLAPAIVIQGGITTGVAVSSASGVQLFGVVVEDTCGKGPGQYDVDIVGSGSVKLRGQWCNFGGLSSLRLANMASPANVVIDKVNLDTLLLQDCGGPMLNSGIQLHLATVLTPVTLQLVNTGGTRVIRSAFSDITIDATSSDNQFIQTSAGSLTDNGSNNCGEDNTGFTLPPCP